jgi:cell division protease FtsH
MVMRLPERDSYSFHRDKMYANLAVAMGGRVAEELVFGHEKVTSGASGDIQMATDLARAMVTQWGMSEALGPLKYSENQEEVFLGHSVARQQNVSERTAELIDSEIKRLVVGGYERARQILTDHGDALEKVAQALLEYETLTGAEIRKAIAGEVIDRPDAAAKLPPLGAGGVSGIPKTGRRPRGGLGGAVAEA